MTSSRDDMVIRPRLVGAGSATEAQRRANEARQLAKQVSHRGIIGRLARAKAATQSLEATGRIAGRVAGRVAIGEAAGAAGEVAEASAERAALMNPVALTLAAVVTAVAVGARLASGRSFENMGQNLKTMLMGDLAADASAGAQARDALLSNHHLLAATGRQQKASASVKQVYDDLFKLKQMEARGAQLFMNDKYFQADSTIDILIVRARNWLVESWRTHGGDAKLRAWRWAMTGMWAFKKTVSMRGF